jgi:hypothetical protein
MVTVELSDDDAVILDEIITLGIVCHCPDIPEADVKSMRNDAKKMHGKYCKDSKWEPVAREVIRQMAEQTDKVENVP